MWEDAANQEEFQQGVQGAGGLGGVEGGEDLAELASEFGCASEHDLEMEGDLKAKAVDAFEKGPKSPRDDVRESAFVRGGRTAEIRTGLA
jgi:hypothetical protein